MPWRVALWLRVRATCSVGMSRDAERYLRMLIFRCIDLRAIVDMSPELGVRTTTLQSRITRLGMPAPRLLLDHIRLIGAAALFQAQERTVADVVYSLGWCSPQALNKQTRRYLGQSATTFRARCDAETMIETFCRQFIRPHVTVLASFTFYNPQPRCVLLQRPEKIDTRFTLQRPIARQAQVIEQLTQALAIAEGRRVVRRVLTPRAQRARVAHA
jgi:AraC-like DNA-binding protein